MYIKRDNCEKFKRLSRTHRRYLLKPSGLEYFQKHVDIREWEVMSTAAIIDYVKSRGFTNIISLKRDKDGRPYTRDEDGIYVLMNKVEGEKLRLKYKKNCLLLAETIAHFHDAAERFSQPAGIKVRANWGKKLEKFRVLTYRLDKYRDYLNKNENINEFEKCTREYIGMLSERARASMKIMKSIGYLMALENSMKKKEICINSISSNTALLQRDSIIITKVFDMGYNMAEEDIAAIVKKMIEETGDRGAIDEIIAAYSSIRCLQEKSDDIIRALVNYPLGSVKIISRYMERNKGGAEEDESRNQRLLEKFRKYLGKEQMTNVLEV